MEDANLNLPELRADQVFVRLNPDGSRRYAVYTEYQAAPDQGQLPGWCAKWGMLVRQLKIGVAMLVIYVEKGDYATFPDSYIMQEDGWDTTLRFNRICLWEHTDRIRRGDLPELAPLLSLYEEHATEATLREEIKLIDGIALPDEAREDLLSLAVRVASRRFPLDLLRNVFREEMEMERHPIVEEYFQEVAARARAVGEAIGKARTAEEIAKVVSDAVSEAEARAQANESRRFARLLLINRFGALPGWLEAKLASADKDWCETVGLRAVNAESIEALALEEQPGTDKA